MKHETPRTEVFPRKTWSADKRQRARTELIGPLVTWLVGCEAIWGPEGRRAESEGKSYLLLVYSTSIVFSQMIHKKHVMHAWLKDLFFVYWRDRLYRHRHVLAPQRLWTQECYVVAVRLANSSGKRKRMIPATWNEVATQMNFPNRKLTIFHIWNKYLRDLPVVYRV